MIWGLLPNNGCAQSPHLLPADDNFTPSPHYIMFNARSETIHTKQSFRNLLGDKKSAVWAVDGYYEWKTSLSPIDKRKQPYFVSSPETPLLLAGLWTEVKTGRRNNNEEETISTFTILTTEAHPKLAWLHPRQPCILTDSCMAREWLENPSKSLVDKIVQSLSNEPQNNIKNEGTIPWQYYPVTKKMNDAKYHGNDCTIEVKSKGRKLDSYFATSPRPDKRKKIEIKEDCSKSTLKQDSADMNAATKCSRIDKERNASLPKEAASNEWSCHICTYTNAKSEYLACEMCGSERECT